MRTATAPTVAGSLVIPVIPAKANKKQKPAKPRPDFPLSAHANGQWCKFITGAPHNPIMFGAWDDPDSAERLYLQERDDWKAGRNPRKMPARATVTTAATLRELADAWLDYRQALVTSSDPELCISWKSYNGSKAAVAAMFSCVSGNLDPVKIDPGEWAALRKGLGVGVSPATQNQRIVHVRAMIRWGIASGRIGAAQWKDREGNDAFAQIPVDALRERRYLFQKENGNRIFTVATARKLLNSAQLAVLSLQSRFELMRRKGGGGSHREWQMIVGSLNYRAATFLAANTGTQTDDIAALADDDVDLDAGWIDTLRQKTKVPWQAPLWPETVRFIRAARAVRCPVHPDALRVWREDRAKYLKDDRMRADAMKATPLLVTADGFPLKHHTSKQGADGRTSYSDSNAIAQAARKQLDSLGLKEPGLDFGAWRPTFQTLAIKTRMREEVDRIFGHKIKGSRDPYCRFTRDDLSPVTDHVRAELFNAELAALVGEDDPEVVAQAGADAKR